MSCLYRALSVAVWVTIVTVFIAALIVSFALQFVALPFILLFKR